jgi:hypothetical protein
MFRSYTWFGNTDKFHLHRSESRHFLTLLIDGNCKQQENKSLGNWICFRLQVRGKETYTLLGRSIAGNPCYVTADTKLSPRYVTGKYAVKEKHLFPEHRVCYLFRIPEYGQSPETQYSESYTLSSEPFRFYLMHLVFHNNSKNIFSSNVWTPKPICWLSGREINNRHGTTLTEKDEVLWKTRSRWIQRKTNGPEMV